MILTLIYDSQVNTPALKGHVWANSDCPVAGSYYQTFLLFVVEFTLENFSLVWHFTEQTWE